MDFEWSAQQQELRRAVEELAQRELNQGLADRERRNEFNRDGWQTLADFGVHGLPIPSEYGGMGMDALTAVGILERLGYGCQDNGLVFSLNAHMWTAAIPILEFGEERQKKKFLPRLCSGEWVGGNAMSEASSGSDAYSLTTTADCRGNHYLLNGSKTFVTNGPIADVIVVFATVDPSKGVNGVSAFLVEKDASGLVVGESIEKMGLNTSPMSQLFLENCEVPVENRLGPEGAGQTLFAHSMSWERSCILASAVGAMQRLLEACIEYAKERKQFGEPISKFQLVATKIVDMKVRLETARALLYKTAWLRSRGRSIFLEAAMTKLWISECWVQSAQDALQIHGGYGYMREYAIERELRDALGSRLYSGTSEIQRMLIAALLGL